MADSAIPDRCLAGLPTTERGYGIHMYANEKVRTLVYGSRNQVVMRSLEDPSVCAVFDGHKCRVTVAKFSPNGEWVASGDERGRVLVWGRNNRVIKNEVQVNREVLDLDWSDDGKRIVAVGAASEKFAKCFSWDAGNNFGEVEGHSKKMIACAFKPSRPYRIVTTGEDNLAVYHTGPPFKFGHSMDKHTRYPNDVAFSPDGERYVTVGADSKILVFTGKTGEFERAIEHKEGHKGSIYAVSWHSDGKRFATSSADKSVKIWNAESGELLNTFAFKNDIANMQVGVAWCGDHLLSASLSGALNWLDFDNPSQPRFVIGGHQTPSPSLSVNGSMIATCDTAGRVALWDATSGVATWLAGKGHPNCTGCALSAGGESVYSVGTDDNLRVSDCKSGEYSSSVDATGGYPTFVAASSSDPALAVVGVSQGKVVLFRGGRAVTTVATDYKPFAAALAPDNTEVTVVGDDSKAHVYAVNGDSLSEKKTLVHLKHTSACAYSGDGRLLAVSDKGGITSLYDRASDYAITNKFGFKYHAGAVRGVAFNPSSTRCCTVALDGSIIVWKDLNTMKEADRHEIKRAHDGGCNAVAFLDDTTIVTSGDDVALKFWKVE